MNNISCSNLVKHSCKQMCFLRKKKELIKVTPAMIRGNELAEKKSISEYKEMRGCYKLDDSNLLFYTFDEIILQKNNYIVIEHKNGEYMEDWFIKASIVQFSLYLSLLEKNENKELFTAKFFRKQGYNTNYLDLSVLTNKDNILHLNDIKYSIKVLNAEKIIDFYRKKTIC